MAMTSHFFDTTHGKIFDALVTFSYWSKIHVNIITGSGVVKISFYKGLTRNPEIGFAQYLETGVI